VTGHHIFEPPSKDINRFTPADGFQLSIITAQQWRCGAIFCGQAG
jgi:hypothetical protein